MNYCIAFIDGSGTLQFMSQQQTES